MRWVGATASKDPTDRDLIFMFTVLTPLDLVKWEEIEDEKHKIH
jgi:hypothetical protein